MKTEEKSTRAGKKADREKQSAEGVADFIKALADPVRLRIVCLLSQGELCVCDLHGSLGLPQPTVSRHLAYLRRRGLVETRRKGIWIHYRIAPELGDEHRALLAAAVRMTGTTHLGCLDRETLVQRLACCGRGVVPAHPTGSGPAAGRASDGSGPR